MKPVVLDQLAQQLLNEFKTMRRYSTRQSKGLFTSPATTIQHMCIESSSAHLYAPTTPAPCEYRSHLQADGVAKLWRNE